MKITAIIQARMGSTRLPGKVLKMLCDHSVLGHVINRVGAVKSINDIIIATTTGSMDDAIVLEAQKYGVEHYRGSEHDVLSRYYEAARKVQSDIVIRITSDCPLLDPHVLQQMIAFFFDNDNHYVSNLLVRSFPRGLDAEVFTFESLKTAHQNAVSAGQREHVTPYIYQNSDHFRIGHFVNEEDTSQYRWTLDTIEDWNLIQIIYDHLYRPGRIFCWEEAISLMKENPDFHLLNAHIEQKKLSGSFEGC